MARGSVIQYMTDQNVNVTNYTHRDAREREPTVISRMVWVYIFYNSEVKNVMSGYKMSTCQLSGCCIKNIFKIIMCVYKLFISY